MRTRWAVLAVAVMMGCALSAFAGSPQIGVLDPTCNSSNNTQHGDVTYDFGITGNQSSNLFFNNFNSSANGGGVFTFCNLTHNTWDTAEFATGNFGGFSSLFWQSDAQNNPASPITCSVGTGSDRGFLTCSVTITSSAIDIKYFGEDHSQQVNGIGNNHTMIVTLNSQFSLEGDHGDWKDANGNPVTFAAGVNLTGPLAPPVPEPASLILLGTGVAAMLSRRRKNYRS